MRRDASTSCSSRNPTPRRSGWVVRLLMLSLPVFFLAGVWFMRGPSNGPNTGNPSSPPGKVSSPSVPLEAQTTDMSPLQSAESPAPQQPASGSESAASETKTWSRKDLTGKWVLDHSIRREIDIQPDGTAVMVCTLDYLTSLIYGKELTMNLEWTLDGDLLTHTVVSGTPEKNVKSLTDNFGSSMSYRVLQVDQDQMLLQGPGKSKKQEHWKAVRP